MSKEIEQYKLLHQANKSFGSTSMIYVPEVMLFINYLKAQTILDFGCGKGILADFISKIRPDLTVLKYDPAIAEYSTLPEGKVDLVVNTDVLEHIPEKDLPQVIETISALSENVYFGLHHALAITILPNGENAHCTVYPPSWYHELLGKYFKTIKPLHSAWPLSSVVTFDIPLDIEKKYYFLHEQKNKGIFYIFDKL